MPKGSHSITERFEKCPWAKAISSQDFYLFWPKIWQTFEMVFNKRKHGFSDIFFGFLTIDDWKFDFLLMTKYGKFRRIFQFEKQISQKL